MTLPTDTAAPLRVHDADVVRMLAFQRGDERAFDELYAAWRGRVHRFAHRMLGGRGVAEDVAQETFVRVYRARDRYQPTAAFATYLLRIAANLCTNERRRASARYEVGDGDVAHRQDAAPVEEGPARAAEGAELGRAVEQALLTLPERQRAAVVLARYEGCTMAELAEVLEVSEGAAKVLLHRARERLKVALGPWLDAGGGVQVKHRTNGTNSTHGTNTRGNGADGPDAADTPAGALGEDLWEALGAADADDAESAPEGDGALASRDGPEQALGADLWAALGEAGAVPQPAWGARSADGARAEARAAVRRARVSRAVGLAVAAAVAGGFIGVAVWHGFGAGGVPVEDASLVEQLDFAENLDLVSHPDFDVLLAWDGVAP